MDFRKITRIFIICTGVVWVIFDLFVLGHDATISGEMMAWAFRSPFVPVLWGVLAGHFFIPSLWRMSLVRGVLLGVYAVSLTVAGYLLIPRGGVWVHVFDPLGVFAVSVVAGWVLFPMKKRGVK